MDREELEKIERLSKNATEEIFRLQEEIRSYKSGAESFAEAVSAIKKMTESQEKVIDVTERYIKEIARVDFSGEAEEIFKGTGELVRKLEKNVSKMEEVKKKFSGLMGEIEERLNAGEERIVEKQEEVLEAVREEGKTGRREIRRAREEILEEIRGKERRGLGRIFGKK